MTIQDATEDDERVENDATRWPSVVRRLPKWRNGRRGSRGSKTVNLGRLSDLARQRERELESFREGGHPVAEIRRPATRAGCVAGDDAARPCPYVSCRHHLYLDAHEQRPSITMNFPELEVAEMTAPSCALDVADEGSASLEDVGDLLNMTRERVRQIENLALRKVLRALGEAGLMTDVRPDDADRPASGRRALPIVCAAEDDEEESVE